MRIDRRDAEALFAEMSSEEERRQKEALRIYRPMESQADFHRSAAGELILSGGKRSGKTVAVAAEFASRILGIPIELPNGKKIPLRFPPSTVKEPLLYWVIGWDVDHIGQTIFGKLFESGLFRVIRDKFTGVWRVYNPAMQDDAERFAESEPAGPMIPERFIDTTRGVNGWVWENAGAHNFSTVYLKNGAVINAYPSSSKHAKQGDAVSGIWIDEDIQISGHLKEWQDRLTDKNGWMLWSVWPHTKNDALIRLLDRAAEQEGEDKPDIQAYQLIMSQNAYIPDENKRKALGRMESEDEIARRDRGELLLDMLCMYDFYRGVHTIKAYSSDEEIPSTPTTPMELLRVILTHFGQFPREWTRYLSIDPSHTRTAVGSFVVPPPEVDDMDLGDVAILEWELILRKHSADMLAGEIKKQVEGLNYEAFIMDQQIGKQTRVGNDSTIFEKYAGAFESAGLRARLTPRCFIPGCNRPNDRYRAVRTMMERTSRGIPMLLLVDQKTIGTQLEFNTYRKKQMFINGEDMILDEPANPRKHDAMAMVEYACAYLETAFASGGAYVHPEVYRSHGSKAYRKAMEIIAEFNKKQAPYVHLGPGAVA